MDKKEKVKEQAVLEQRHWVRISRACNNRCVFCLDTDSQDGSMLSADKVKVEIRRGVEIGARRLILSGGEASIHPGFVEFVAYGKSAGYSGIQTITNGRMFAYDRFCRGALDAGLSEVTFSIHGHTPELHDGLTGVPGAFEQAIRGMKNLLDSRRCVVNVDIVINRQNVTRIADIMKYFIGMGIHEFDLLQVVPFGRTYPENTDALLYDVSGALPALRKAFEMAATPGLFVWTNRFPAYYLEGYERLIQDPKKLYDEVNGRRAELFDPFVRDGRELACLGERCRHCFIENFCSSLISLKAVIETGAYDTVRVTAAEQLRHLHRGDAGKTLWLRLPGATEAGDALRESGVRRSGLIVELDSYKMALGLLRSHDDIKRIIVHDKRDIERALEASGNAVVEISVNRSTMEWIDENEDKIAARPEKFSFSVKNHELLSNAINSDYPMRELLDGSRFGNIPVRNIPVCLAGANPRVNEGRTLDLMVFGDDGKIEMFKFVKHYILNEYYAKSMRCAPCLHAGHCRGLHINNIRNFGFGIMRPVSPEAGEAAERSLDIIHAGAAPSGRPPSRDFWKTLGFRDPGKKRFAAGNGEEAVIALRQFRERYEETWRAAVSKLCGYKNDVNLLPEVAMFRLGLRKILHLEVPSAFAERVAADFHEFHVNEEKNEAAGVTALSVYASEEYYRREQALKEDDHFVRGHLQGLPACCVEHFSSMRNPHLRAKTVCDAAMNTAGAFSWMLNNVIGLHGLRLISHAPCSYDCPVSLGAAREVFRFHRERRPELADAIERYLPAAMLYFNPRMMVILNGEKRNGRFRYTGYSPLCSLGAPADEAWAAMFHNEIVMRLEGCDSLGLTDGALNIYSGKRRAHTLEREHIYAGALLNFNED